MNTDPVEIKFKINNDELEQQSKRAVSSILGIGSSSEDVKRELQEQLQIQKQVISELEAQYKSAKKVFDALKESGIRINHPKVQEAENLYKQVESNLKSEKEKLKELKEQYKELTTTQITRIRKVVNDMIKLRSEGKQETAQYKELEAQLQKLGTTYKTVNKEKNLLTSGGNSTIAGITSGMTGLAGAFAAGQGVMSLFVKDNERLAEIQTKLQAAMSITIGLQQVSNTLHATSAFRIKTVAQVTDLWNKSVNYLNVSLGISNALSKALVAGGIGLLIASAGYLISKLQEWRKEQEEINRIQKEFKDVEIETAKAMAKNTVEVNQLVKIAGDHNKTLELRKAAVERLNKIMPDYNGHINKEGELIANSETALKNYLVTLYKVEKAKNLLAGIETKQAEYDALMKQGSKPIEFWEEVLISFTAIFDKKQAANALNEAQKENVNIWIDSLDKLDAEKKEFEKKFQELISDKSIFDALFPPNKPAGKNDKRLEREAQNRLNAEQKLDEALRRLALEKQKFDIETRQKEIDLMEDSFAKRSEQLKLNYDKELQQAREFSENKLKEQQEIEKQGYIKAHGNDLGFTPVTTEIIGLPEEIKEQIKKLYVSAKSEFDKGNTLLARDLEDFIQEQSMRFASSLENQLYDIEEYYKKRIRQAEGNEELIKQLIIDKGKEILNANTRNQIEQLEFEKNIELQRMALSDKRYLFEADKEKEILNITIKYAEKRLNLLKKLQSEGIQGLENEIKELEVEIEGLNKGLNEIPVKRINEALAGIKSITSALSGLDGEIGEIFSSLGSSIDSISESFKRAKSGTNDYLGAISSAISGVVEIINMISAANSKRKQAEREFYKNSIALAHEYALAMNKALLSQSEGAGFITDYAGQINDAFNSMYDATNKYYEALEKLSSGKAKIDLRDSIDWGNVLKGLGTGAAVGAAIGSIIPVIGTAIGAVVGGLIGGIAGLFGGKKKSEVFGGLLDVFPELIDASGNLNKELAQTLINTKQLNDETTQLLQNALDWADAIESANEKIRGIVVDLAGDLGGSIKNALVEAWKAGEDASKRMFAAASDSLGKFIKDLLYSTVFSDIFKQFQEDLIASLNPITGDQDVIDDFDRLMKSLNERDDFYLAALEALNERAKDYGFDFKGLGNKQSAETGGFKAVSQDAFDLWLGQFAAIRIHTENIFSVMVREGEIMMGVFSRIEENTKISADCLVVIQGLVRKFDNEGIRII